jgi:hypothetical protein
LTKSSKKAKIGLEKFVEETNEASSNNWYALGCS